MLEIPGYTLLETIHKGKRVTVFRAFKSGESARKNSCIVKVISGVEGFSSDESLDIRGYQYQRHLNHRSINRVEDIIELPGLCAVVSEDVGGMSVAHWIKAYKQQHKKWMLSDHALLRPHLLRLMTWVIQIAEAIVTCHRCRLIHNAISLSNIIVNPQKDNVQLIDFSAAFSAPDALRYTNVVDYRTDFYDLGVVLYQLFSGQESLEFNATVELPLSEFNTLFPQILSNVVQRLMEAEPEDRYQNGKSIIEDLQRIYSSIKTGSELSNVRLVEKDIPESLYISNKLYGVDGHIDNIADWIVGEDKQHLICVSGPAGVGKTVLVNESLRRIDTANVLCLLGKFEQFSQSSPDGLAQVLSDGVGHLLSLPEKQLVGWCEELIDALGNHAYLLLALIPDIESLFAVAGREIEPVYISTGPPELHPARLSFVVSILITKIAEEIPLVIFLDDLQWCSDRTFKLLEALILIKHPAVTFVLTVRQDEVDGSDILSGFTYDLITQSVKIKFVKISDLGCMDVQSLLEDTFHSGEKSVEGLAELTIKKTHGNPFFIREFLKAAYQKNDGTLYFDLSKQAWEWSSQRLASLVATGNVIEVLLNNIAELSDDVKLVLSWASFLGDAIDLPLLASITGLTAEQCQLSIEVLKREGLIRDVERSINENTVSAGKYAFVHDLVQQTIYDKINRDVAEHRHFTITLHCMDQLEVDSICRRDLLGLLVHINNLTKNSAILKSLSGDSSKQMVLLLEKGASELWLTEEHRTRLEYLRSAHKLLTQTGCSDNQGLSRILFKLSEAEYIAGDGSDARLAIERYREIKTSAVDQARSYYHQMNYEGFDQGPRRIVELGLSALECLGVDYPPLGSDFSMLAKNEIADMDILQKEFSLFDQVNHELSSDEKLILLQAIYARINFLSPRVSGVDMFIYGNLQGLRTILSSGCTRSSPELLMNYAVVLILQEKYVESRDVSSFAMKLIGEHEIENCGFAKTIFGGLLARYFRTISQCGTLLDDAEKINRERGDHQLVSASKSYRVMLNFLGGSSLIELKKITDELRSHSEMHDQTISGGMLYWRLVEQLTNVKSNNYLEEGFFDDEDWAECNNTRLKIFLYYLNVQRLIFRNEYYEALALITDSGMDIVMDCTRDLPIYDEYQFIKVICTLQCQKDLSTLAIDRVLSLLGTSIIHLERISSLNPDSYAHLTVLVSAEIARVRLVEDPSALFNQAAELAKKSGAVAIYALANELHGQYWSEQGRLDYANLHYGNALNGYSRWGCEVKVAYLDMICDELFSDEDSPDLYEQEKDQDSFMSPISREGTLDNISYLKISNAITEEMNLQTLLEHMILVVLENVGAEEGFLLLKNNDEYELFSHALVGERGIDVVSIPSENAINYPVGVVNYCSRSKKTILLANAVSDSRFNGDNYFVSRKVKSLLGFPIEHKSSVSAVFVLTNSSVESVFSQSHINFISALAPQFAVSIENARLYENLRTLNRSLENSIEHQTEELNAANEELRDFSASVSHDLKSPLRQIYGLSYALKADIEQSLPEDGVEYIQHVCDATDRMGRIIDGLLMLSRSTGSTLQWENIDLSEVVRDQINWLKNMEPDRKVLVEVESDVVGYGDLQLLHQVIDNLLSNSWKYTKKTEVPIIVFGKKSTDRHPNTYFIQDNGDGFDMANAVDMFKPFRRFHSTQEFEGTGIGLATVSRIINRHGGEIWAESKKGEGATLYFTLNASERKDKVVESGDAS
ncbi:hypothetical protein A9Q99_16515 [Gammaproteobacteria bacterium 45_16_T64]|nr:hypothetical protein A9Q99_16515 [Gammaproteobacteria bacterium 45_16_T64]